MSNWEIVSLCLASFSWGLALSNWLWIRLYKEQQEIIKYLLEKK